MSVVCLVVTVYDDEGLRTPLGEFDSVFGSRGHLESEGSLLPRSFPRYSIGTYSCTSTLTRRTLTHVNKSFSERIFPSRSSI